MRKMLAVLALAALLSTGSARSGQVICSGLTRAKGVVTGVSKLSVPGGLQGYRVRVNGMTTAVLSYRWFRVGQAVTINGSVCDGTLLVKVMW